MTRVYFATNRRLLKNRRPWFDNEPTTNGDLRFGYSDISESDKFGVNKVTILPDDEKEGSFSVFAGLQKIMKESQRDTLLYIHGYKNSFEGALSDAARLVARIKSASNNSHSPNIILFSWPSDGKLLKYISDRKDAQNSSIALARAILKYYDFLCEQRKSRKELCDQNVNVLCHSMGNYVFRHTVQQLIALKTRPLTRLFDEVLLVSADEDNDTFDFEYKMLPLVNMSRRITVYFNKEDAALVISDKTKGNPQRLGTTGPLHTATIPSTIKCVDTTRVVKGVIEHGYHIEEKCAIVHADIASTLMGIPSEEISGRTYIPQSNKFVLKA